ncbi:MFS transporter [Roseibium sp.]|uniref:MFS transporter n=1 Tax=Roseibium sp. TaxID=1936156 RepID=UPI003B52B0CD
MMSVALLLCPFAFTMGAFVFSGVLAPMAEALGVSVGAAAALQSGFAIACALSGPVLARLTAALPRKSLLLGVLFVLTVLNAGSAVAADYPSLLVLRILVGGLGALAFPLATAIAATNTSEEGRPAAIAKVYAGIPLAMIAGIPLGSVLGNAFGWQACFAATALFCALAFAMVLAFVPANQLDPQKTAVPNGALNKGVLAHLGIMLLASTALFTLVGLLGPVIRALTGFGGPGIAALQVLAGVGSLVGIKMGARQAGGGRYLLSGLFAVLAASLAVTVPSLGLQHAGTAGLIAITLSVILGPIAQFAIGATVQARLARLAGPSATLVFSLNASMVYLGQGLGIAFGALALDLAGIAGAPAIGTVIALIGCLFALRLGRSTAQQNLQTVRG